MLKLKRPLLSIMEILILGSVLVTLSGCIIGTRVLIVPPSTPLVIRKTVKDWPVYVLDEKTGEFVKANADLHAGQHVITLQGEQE